MPSRTPDEGPEAGERRFWRIIHNPKSSTKPLTIELRSLFEGATIPTDGSKGFSTLIGQGASPAQPGAVKTEKERILMVAARVDEFVGCAA